MERKLLKKVLYEVSNNNYKVPENFKPFDLTLEMLNYIGDIDSELRDDLILTILYKWILNDILTTEEIYKVVSICLDESHLFYGIGQENDTVFTRTFSVLVIAFALRKDRDRKYLNTKDIDMIFKEVIQFANDDNDVRGYIEGKGWAHGTAHLADAFKELTYCKELGYKELKIILNTIRDKIHINYYTYIHEEDERLVTAVTRLLERETINNSEIIDWIKSFSKMEKINKYPVDFVIKLNTKNFLRSLYFRLYDRPEYLKLCDNIREVLNDMNRFK